MQKLKPQRLKGRVKLSKLNLLIFTIVFGAIGAYVLIRVFGLWVTNSVQLDNGTCGINLQIGYDKASSANAKPTFLIQGDGPLSSYAVSIDGNPIGNFAADGYSNVCINDPIQRVDGTHTFTATETTPHPTLAVAPLSFSVDTVAPAVPAVPAMSGYSDSGVLGDYITKYRGVNFYGKSEPLDSMQLYNNGVTGVGGAKADTTGSWSATTTQLAEGNYSITVAAFDGAGNKSAQSSPPVALTIDTTAPAAPAVPVLSPASDTAPTGDNTTTITTPVVTGTTAADVWKVLIFSDGVQVGTVTPDASHNWNFTLPTLATGTHSIALKVNDAADNLSALGTALSLTIGAASTSTAPGAPTLGSPTAGDATVTLSWNAPSSNGGSAITGYKVYRGTSSGSETLLASLGAATTYTDTSVVNSTAYYYQVSAVNSVGEGPRSSESSATPTAPITVPGVPSLNSATGSNSSVALAWSAPSNGGSVITGYKLYRGTSSGSETALATIGNQTSYTDNTAVNGTTYYYQVSALNSVGEGSRSSEKNATPMTMPGAPNLTNITAGNGSAALTWSTPSSNGSPITGYKLYRGTSTGTETLLATLGTVTSYTDTNLTNGVTYYYQVSAVNGAGEGTKSSELSVTPKTTPLAPILNSATPSVPPAPDSITLAWSAPTSNGGSPITGYKLYRGTSTGTETLLATWGTGTTYTDSTVTNGTTYYYKISAVNGAGEGILSNEKPAATLDTTAPTVNLTSPSAGATVTSTPTTLSAAASDNVGVAHVDFLVDGTVVNSDNTFPYSYSWDSSSVGNGPHSIAAKAYDGANNPSVTNPSNSVAVTVCNNDCTPPTAPTGLSASATAYNKIHLSWTASTDNVGVTGYTIQRSTDSGASYSAIGSSTTNSYDDTSVAANTTYYYRVLAYDAKNNFSSPSAPANDRTPSPPDTEKPTVPTLTAKAASSSQIDLSWPASTDNVGVVAYDIYRANDSLVTSFSPSSICTPTIPSTCSWGDTNLNPSTNYSYYVKARDAAGNVAQSNTASDTTQAPPATVPGQPTLNTATPSSNSVALSWSAPTSNGGSPITGYKLYRGTSTGTETLLATWGTGTTYTDSTVTNGTTYYYQVSALNSVGEGSRSSEKSASPTAPTDSEPPTVIIGSPTDGITVSSLFDVRATASDNSGIVTRLEFYIDGVWNWTDYDAPYSFSWDTTLLTNGVHTLAAKAYDKVGNAASDVIAVTVQNGDNIALSPPTNLSADVSATGNVHLTWDIPSGNVVGYTIQRSTDNDTSYAAIATSPTNIYDDASVAAGTTYYYRVLAYDDKNNFSSPSTPLKVPIPVPAPPDTEKPTAPGNLMADVINSNQTTLSWIPATDNVAVTLYSIYRGTSSTSLVYVGSSGTSSFGDGTTLAAKTYYYYVVAEDAAGNVSARSNQITITTPSVVTGLGSVTGTIKNNSNQGISGAKTTYYVGTTRKSVTSNTSGHYVISSLSPGAKSLTFSATGYMSQTSTVTVLANKNVLQDSKLTKLGSITGTVTNSAGQPLSSVTVKYILAGSSKSLRTSSSGKYTITNLPAGSYRLTFSLSNYTTQTADISVTNDQNTIKDISLIHI